MNKLKITLPFAFIFSSIAFALFYFMSNSFGYNKIFNYSFGLTFILILFVLFNLLLLLVLNIESIFSKNKNVYSQQSGNSQAKNYKKLTQKITEIQQDKDEQLSLLEDREQYRREFLGNVSHELKTPLFTIQGYILTLIEGAVNDKKVRDKYLNRINKSVDRLVYIIKDLDLLSELEKGKIQLQKSSFNIVALTQEVFDLLETKAENLVVRLKFDKTYYEQIKVYGDIEKIEQVLVNLIANAISYSEKENATVEISFIELNNNEIQVKVSDNGKGIKAESLDRIFERFYRTDTARSRNNGGSGLGLSIVKHILEAHNQEISVESEYQKGTSFQFKLKKSKD